MGWRLTGGGPELHQIRQYTMNGVEIGTEANLEALAGGSGLGRFYDAELMSNGKVMMLGYVGLTAVANQVFDLGDEVLRGTNGAETLYGKDGVNDVNVGNGGSDRLNGLSGNDVIDGGIGDDRINAGAGNDLLNGGLNNDTLTGGLGFDTFIFNTALNATTNVDRISDFVAINDTIRLENAVFTGLGAVTVRWRQRPSKPQPPARLWTPATASSTTRQRANCVTTPTATALRQVGSCLPC